MRPTQQLGESLAGLVVLADDKQFSRLKDQVTPTRQEAMMNTKLKFAFERRPRAQFVTKRLARTVRQRSRRRSVRSTSAKAQCRRQNPENTYCYYRKRIT